MKKVPRTWTRGQYKCVMRWLRMARNVIQRQVDEKGMVEYIQELAVYGESPIK